MLIAALLCLNWNIKTKPTLGGFFHPNPSNFESNILILYKSTIIPVYINVPEFFFIFYF